MNNPFYRLIQVIILVVVYLSFPMIAIAEDSDIEIRRFDNTSIEQFQDSDDFFYIKENKTRTDYKSIFYAWINKLVTTVFGSDIGLFILSKLHYLMIIIVVALLLYKSSSIKFFGSYRKSGAKLKGDFFEDIDFVENIDFDILITKALKNSNYRLAIRYQYLNILKILSLDGLIYHSPHKTNVEYIYELKDDSLAISFKQVVQIFDYVWYGDKEINSDNYSHFQPYFTSFEKLVSNNKSSIKK